MYHVCLAPIELRIVKYQELHLLCHNEKASYLTLTLPRVLWVALGQLLFLAGPMAIPISAQEQFFFPPLGVVAG